MVGENKGGCGAPKVRAKRILKALSNHPTEATKDYSRMIQNKIESLVAGYQVPCPEHKYERYFRIAKGGTVVDVGAHIALFTVSVAKRAGRVIAIEPDPRNLLDLRHTLCNLSNVVIVGKAGVIRLLHERMKQKEAMNINLFLIIFYIGCPIIGSYLLPVFYPVCFAQSSVPTLRKISSYWV